MPTPADVARAHQRAQDKLIQATVAAAVRATESVDPQDIARSWAGGPRRRTLALAMAAQRQAARAGDGYVQRVIEAAEADPAAQGGLVPEAFSGVASDGRPLPSLLDIPALRASQMAGDGASADEAVAQMMRTLAMILATQIADAGRAAAGVSQTVRPAVIGWERVVNMPACSRCIILSGVLYKWSDGFQRHPNCDCVHLPVVAQEDRDRRKEANPAKRIFDGLSREEQDLIFGVAGAQAIRDGADIAKVVNARRGMRTSASGRRKPVTNRRARGGPRMMPEDIYRIAKDRDEAIRLLKRFGFIV